MLVFQSINHSMYILLNCLYAKRYCLLRPSTNPLVYTVCLLVHDILFQIPLSRKDIFSRFWLVKIIVRPHTRQKQANQKRLYISMRLGEIWNKISCTNTQTVKTTVWHKQTGCSAGYDFTSFPAVWELKPEADDFQIFPEDYVIDETFRHHW